MRVLLLFSALLSGCEVGQRGPTPELKASEYRILQDKEPISLLVNAKYDPDAKLINVEIWFFNCTDQYLIVENTEKTERSPHLNWEVIDSDEETAVSGEDSYYRGHISYELMEPGEIDVVNGKEVLGNDT